MADQETPKATSTRTVWIARVVYQGKGEGREDWLWPPKIFDHSFATEESAEHDAAHRIMNIDGEGLSKDIERRVTRKTIAISIIKQEITDTVEERVWPENQQRLDGPQACGPAYAESTGLGKVF